MNKRDIFYYAKFYGIPVYYQSEENEMVGRNWFYNLLLDIVLTFVVFFCNEEEFKLEIENRTIKREEIE
jgi:hypothetical protein